MWQRGEERAGWRKGKGMRNGLREQRGMGRRREQYQRHIAFAIFLLPCLRARGLCCDAVCERLLAASPELAPGPHCSALGSAGSWEAAPCPFSGPRRGSTPPGRRGHSSAANKASQTAELAGKLGAVTQDRCSSGHARVHLQGPGPPGFHHSFLPLQEQLQAADLLHLA